MTLGERHLIVTPLLGCCGRREVLTVIADEYSVGPNVRFEEQAADWVNEKLERLAVTQVVRVSSAGVVGVQLADFRSPSGTPGSISRSTAGPVPRLEAKVRRPAIGRPPNACHWHLMAAGAGV